MSDQPKVSERMWKIVNAAISAEVGLNLDPDSPHRFIESTAAKNLLLSAIAEIEQRAGEIDFFAGIVREHYADIVMPEVEDRDAAKSSDWVNCAIMELGNQHKRAEKWKEAALALRRFEECEMPYRSVWPAVGSDIALINSAHDRRVAAIAALGDEWNEAVKGEG